jgi:hypothetical protein
MSRKIRKEEEKKCKKKYGVLEAENAETLTGKQSREEISAQIELILSNNTNSLSAPTNPSKNALILRMLGTE